MDRLNAWLNARRGWLRFALLCLGGWPLALMLGNGVIAAVDSASFSPGSRFVLPVVVLSIPGAVPVAGLMLLIWPWSVRYAGKHGKPEKPLLDWRFSVGMLFLAGAQAIGVLQNTEPYRWNHAHPELFPITVLLMAASVLVMLWDYRYQRRITRTNGSAPAAGTNPYTWPW